MDSSILKRLLKRYDSGSASKTERYLIDRWYHSFGDMGDQTPGVETEDQAMETKERMLSRITAQRSRPVKRWYQQPAIRIAASVAVVASLILLLYPYKPAPNQNTLVYQTEKGEAKKIILADSTQVWMNANTRLEVLPGYAEDYRKVKLTGEAYFQVTNNPDKPFIIASEELQTQVLGTSFNVSAYPKLDNIRVTVNTGKVSVSKGNQLLSTLTPGRSIEYNKPTQRVTLMETDTDSELSWRDGRIMLDDASFDELAEKFGNMFNITLYSEDKVVKQLRFRLMIDHALPMEENLKLITGIHQLKFRKTNGNEIEIYHN